jgi:nitroimidazol reductase NimA-like FMN-containing flavoprotein (pyridoxamine 5'-phosphate oxidase superfamily)
MEQDQVQRELDAARDLLDASSFAHLAYVAKDGTPRVIATGFYWTGEEAVMSTATTSPKVAALAARPEVAITVDAGDSPDEARAVSIRGKADITIVDGVVEEYLLAARRSMSSEDAEQFEENVRQMYPQMARIAVVPTWVRYWDFGSGRMPQFLQELAAESRGQ